LALALWILLTTAIVIVAGISVMLAWSAVNQMLAGQTADINWLLTFAALVVIVLAAVAFVAISAKLAAVTHDEHAGD
jgi:hypothetical protein